MNIRKLIYIHFIVLCQCQLFSQSITLCAEDCNNHSIYSDNSPTNYDLNNGQCIVYPINQKPHNSNNSEYTNVPIDTITVTVIHNEDIELNFGTGYVDFMNTIYKLSRIGYIIKVNQIVPYNLDLDGLNEVEIINEINDLEFGNTSNRVLVIDDYNLPTTLGENNRAKNIKITDDFNRRLWLFKPSEVNEVTNNLSHFLLLHESMHDFINADEFPINVHHDYECYFSLFNTCSVLSFFITTEMINTIHELSVIDCNCGAAFPNRDPSCEYILPDSRNINSYLFPLNLQDYITEEEFNQYFESCSGTEELYNEIIAEITEKKKNAKSGKSSKNIEDNLISQAKNLEKEVLDELEVKLLKEIYSDILEKSIPLGHEQASQFKQNQFISNSAHSISNIKETLISRSFNYIRLTDMSQYKKVSNRLEPNVINQINTLIINDNELINANMLRNLNNFKQIPVRGFRN